MRSFFWITLFGLPGVAPGHDASATFGPAREVLEIRCLECHTPEKAKGDLVMTTRDGADQGR